MSPDAADFREVLGHFPTGVVLVTGIAEDGEPVGMILGTFMSVSLEPPIVGFLPARDSSTWARLKTAKGFCVNVLAADQTDLCRSFSRKGREGRFEDIGWTPSSAGAPVVDGAIATIDCTVRSVLDGGDHVIVLGDVTDLQLRGSGMPLLFFQGGFGRFTTHSLVIGAEGGLIEATRSAELARAEIEGLAERLNAECALLTRSGDATVVVAAATAGSRQPAARLGVRLPLVPPLGATFMAYADHESAEQWLRRKHPLDKVPAEDYRRRLDIIRERGWSVDMTSAYSEAEFFDVIDRFGGDDVTPAQQRELLATISAVSGGYVTIDIEPGRVYDIGGIMAPVLDNQGNAQLVLRASQLPGPVPGTQIHNWIAEVTAVASRIEDVIAASFRLDRARG